MIKKIVYALVAIAVVLHLIGLLLGQDQLPQGVSRSAYPGA